MKKYLNFLKSVSLFSGIDSCSLEDMLVCLGASISAKHKGEFFLSAGDIVDHIGIVLEGQLHILREDSIGTRELIAVLSPGDLFAEALCCAGVSESPVSVLSDKDSRVLLLAFGKILRMCPKSCEHHSRLIQNMLRIVATKNLLLQSHLELLSKKTIRTRLMSYLESISKGRNDFTIPLNREELADFLCIDRSALSRELGRLKNEGIIDFWKNHFRF